MEPKKIGNHMGRDLYLYRGNVLAEEKDGRVEINVGPLFAVAERIEMASLVFDGLIEELIRSGAKPKIRKAIV